MLLDLDLNVNYNENCRIIQTWSWQEKIRCRDKTAAGIRSENHVVNWTSGRLFVGSPFFFSGARSSNSMASSTGRSTTKSSSSNNISNSTNYSNTSNSSSNTKPTANSPCPTANSQQAQQGRSGPGFGYGVVLVVLVVVVLGVGLGGVVFRQSNIASKRHCHLQFRPYKQYHATDKHPSPSRTPLDTPVRLADCALRPIPPF